MQAVAQAKRDAGWAVLLSGDGLIEVGRGHVFVDGGYQLGQDLGSMGSNSTPNDWQGALDPFRLLVGTSVERGQYRLRPEYPHQYSAARTGNERAVAQELLVEVTLVERLEHAEDKWTVWLFGLDGLLPEILVELGGE